MPLGISNGPTKEKKYQLEYFRLTHATNDNMQKQITLCIPKQCIKIKQAHSIKFKAE